MDTSLKMAWTLLVVAGVFTASAILDAQPNEPVVRLGPEVWLIIAGGLVTVGVNLEQLRRVRSDVRKVSEDTEKKHGQNSTKLDSIVMSHAKFDRRLDHVELELRFLTRRRGRDDSEDERDHEEKGR